MAYVRKNRKLIRVYWNDGVTQEVFNLVKGNLDPNIFLSDQNSPLTPKKFNRNSKPLKKKILPTSKSDSSTEDENDSQQFFTEWIKDTLFDFNDANYDDTDFLSFDIGNNEVLPVNSF